jgi:hypothetical protein
MRQFLSSDAPNLAIAATNGSKTSDSAGLFQNRRFELKLAQGLLDSLQSTIDQMGQEK